MKLSKKYVLIGLALATSFVAFGVAYAAFADRSEVKGTSVSVGSANIKLYKEMLPYFSEANMLDILSGPKFENIGKDWEQDYLVKIHNMSTSSLALTSTANYETINDPSDLRSIIYVEIFPWQDLDQNMTVSPDELGVSFGKKTIVKWKTEGFSLGNVNTNEAAGFVLRFSATNISDTKQGAQLLFDFMFDSVALN